MADFRQMAIDAARKYNIPTDLFLAQINQESRWNPAAVSDAGAIGLGQLMPGTAKELGVDPRDPAQNLDGAARYMAQQYKTFGDWGTALAAYNAGPGAVSRYGGIPPYKETQNYVRTILGQRGGAMTPEKIAKDATAQSTGGGILNMLGGQQQQRPPLRERFRDPNFWNEVALTFHSMSSFPNEQAIRALQSRVERNREVKKEQDQLNKTVEFFRKMGRDDLVQLAQVSPSGALNLYAQSSKPGYKVMTGEQVNAMYGSKLEPTKLFNVSPTGQVTQVGGSGTTINMGEGGYQEEFYKQDAKKLAERFDAMRKGGAVAAENLQTLKIMRDLYAEIPSGQITGRFLQLLPGATDPSAIVDSLRTSLAPKLRVEGSGSTSDIEYEGMLKSLGSFTNSPQANKAIIDLMMAKMELNAKRAEIANSIRPGQDPYEAMDKIQQLENQLWVNNPLIAQIKQVASSAPRTSPQQTPQGEQLSDEDLIKKYTQ